jgi:hypothetical protein
MGGFFIFGISVSPPICPPFQLRSSPPCTLPLMLRASRCADGLPRFGRYVLLLYPIVAMALHERSN